MRARPDLVVHGVGLDDTAVALLVALAARLRPVAATAARPTQGGATHFVGVGDPVLARRCATDGPTLAWLGPGAATVVDAGDGRQDLRSAWAAALREGAILAGPAPLPGLDVTVVPAGARELAGFAWLPPLVRARRRHRLGLAPTAVGDLRPEGVRTDGAAAAVLASSAAVRADARWVLPALATGVPVFVDDDVRAALPDELAELTHADGPGRAEQVAGAERADPGDATRRSRGISTQVHARFDLTRTSSALAGALRRRADVVDPDARLWEHLGELGTPAGSFVAHRAETALSSLVPIPLRRTS